MDSAFPGIGILIRDVAFSEVLSERPFASFPISSPQLFVKSISYGSVLPFKCAAKMFIFFFFSIKLLSYRNHNL